MSLDCQLEEIKANISNDKSMLRQTKLVYILKKLLELFWVTQLWNFSPWANLRPKVLAKACSTVWTVSHGSASSSFPACVFLSSPSISPSSLLTILDQGFSTLYPLLLASWLGNGFELILGVFKWHPSYLDELQQLFLKSVARFNLMPGITPWYSQANSGLYQIGNGGCSGSVGIGAICPMLKSLGVHVLQRHG